MSTRKIICIIDEISSFINFLTLKVLGDRPAKTVNLYIQIVITAKINSNKGGHSKLQGTLCADVSVGEMNKGMSTQPWWTSYFDEEPLSLGLFLFHHLQSTSLKNTARGMCQMFFSAKQNNPFMILKYGNRGQKYVSQTLTFYCWQQPV